MRHGRLIADQGDGKQVSAKEWLRVDTSRVTPASLPSPKHLLMYFRLRCIAHCSERPSASPASGHRAKVTSYRRSMVRYNIASSIVSLSLSAVPSSRVSQ